MYDDLHLVVIMTILCSLAVIFGCFLLCLYFVPLMTVYKEN